MSRKARVITPDEERESSIKSVVQRSRRVLSEGLEQRLATLGVFTSGSLLEQNNPLERRMQALVGTHVSGSDRRELEETLEDCQRVRAVVSDALRQWPAEARDTREVLPQLLPLALYAA